MKASLCAAGLSVFMFTIGDTPSNMVFAQGNAAACPVAGMVIKGTNNQGEYITTTKGADPGDSSICVRVTEGPGAGVLHGKETKAIYGWYSLSARDVSEKSRDAIRKGFGAVLSGQSNEATFEATFAMPGKGLPWTNTQVWSRTGQASVSVDGRAVNAITLHYSEKGGANSNYEGEWDLWYDPVRHIWLKGEVRAPGGPIRGGFLVTSVSPP